jgi:hypothetical protein
MREKYWSLYETVKRSERYFFYYRERAQRRDRWIKVFLCAASLSSVANLAFWGQAPLFWPIISVIAQILSAVAYLIPYSDQVRALNDLLPELDMLIHRIDYHWDQINILRNLTDEEINALVLDYNMEFTKLESQYTKYTPFSPSKHCSKKAESDFKKFYNSRFYPPQRNYLEEALNHVF